METLDLSAGQLGANQLDVLLREPPDLEACFQPDNPGSDDFMQEVAEVIDTHNLFADLLIELERDQGVALLVVTHSADLASRMDRSLELRDGIHAYPIGDDGGGPAGSLEVMRAGDEVTVMGASVPIADDLPFGVDDFAYPVHELDEAARTRAAEIVLQHHENFDGTGYPQGLKGEGICVGARIFHVIDAYDGCTTSIPAGEYALHSYHNNFTCIPEKVVYRPERVTPKPLIRGPQTAVVVGPAGEEIYPDEYGRVKVQFHWDRNGKNDENSSCWTRVSQIHAADRGRLIRLRRSGASQQKPKASTRVVIVVPASSNGRLARWTLFSGRTLSCALSRKCMHLTTRKRSLCATLLRRGPR